MASLVFSSFIQNNLNRCLFYSCSTCLKHTQLLMRRRSTWTVGEFLEGQTVIGQHVSLTGWVQSVRPTKQQVFLHLNDRTSTKHCQLVIAAENFISEIQFGSYLRVEGEVVKSIGPQQSHELLVNKVEHLGPTDQHESPIKKARQHNVDFLREKIHLRAKTQFFSSLLLIRSKALQAFRTYFEESGFVEINSAILTTNDCEGGGEVFRVEPNHQWRTGADEADHFFGRKVFLSNSGQLHLESMVGGLNKVFCLGPTFRAERARRRFHLCEFYMLEAEVNLISLPQLLDLIEESILYAVRVLYDECQPHLQQILESQESKKKYQVDLEKLCETTFARVTYSEAIELLQKEDVSPLKWGDDLGREHEIAIVKSMAGRPTFVTDFPIEAKPFYSKHNPDGQTAASVDLLMGSVGEVCGGSLREENAAVMAQRLKSLENAENLQWYVELRKYGCPPHGGFGLGFERFLQLVTGIPNIKDTIPFPRYQNNCAM